MKFMYTIQDTVLKKSLIERVFYALFQRFSVTVFEVIIDDNCQQVSAFGGGV